MEDPLSADLAMALEGSYSCLRTILPFQRKYSYYLLQLYIPSFMLVIVSWVSFWLDKDSVPARVSLGVTTLLTMTTTQSGINAKLPPVSYTKAVDVWIGVCLAFIFAALLEFAFVNYAGRMEHMEKENKRKPSSVTQVDMQPADKPTKASEEAESDETRKSKHSVTWLRQSDSLVDFQTDDPKQVKSRQSILTPGDHYYCPQCNEEEKNVNGSVTRPLVATIDFESVSKMYSGTNQPIHPRHEIDRFCNSVFSMVTKHHETSKRIDIVSRVVFPFLFLFFNVVYWLAYLTNSDRGSDDGDH